MRNLIAVVITLTVWLGASQHCNLEAAGILTHHEESCASHCPDSLDGCHTDGCHVVESSAYRVSASSSLVAVPSLMACDCLICLSLVAPPFDDALSVWVLTSIDRVQHWVPAWHFERRTVAAPGAPSSLIA